MAHQTALAFINKVNADAALKARVKSINNIDTLLKFASEAGFEFSAEDFHQAVNAIRSSELSDNDLNRVAGGAIYMKVDGIQGESMDKDHRGQLEVFSFHF